LNNLPGRRGLALMEKSIAGYDYDADEIQSQYSSVRPASTILTSFPNQGHMPPRQSTYSNFSAMQGGSHERLMSIGGISEHANNNPYLSQRPSMAFVQTPPPGEHLANPHQTYMAGSTPMVSTPMGSTPNLLGVSHANASNPRLRSPLSASRPVSTVNFMDGPKNGPTDEEILRALRECLTEINLETVTKKGLKALTEQRLQTQLQGEKKGFLDQMIDIELANM